MSTDTKIKTLIFNKLTQEQYNNADRVPTEFYLTPDTSIDSSEKGAANGVATLDVNGKVPTEQIPTATTSALGGVKPDGTTITVTEDGTISVPVSAQLATKAELQAVDSSKADTALSNVLANIDYVVESQVNSDGSWYRKYKSGWLEQGNSSPTGDQNFTLNKTINFPKPFADNTYMLVGPGFFVASSGAQTITRTTTGFTTGSIQNMTGCAYWYACGQGAQ